jgi:hypothetical protein
MHLGQKLFRFLGSTLATTLGKRIDDNVVLKKSQRNEDSKRISATKIHDLSN